MPYSVSVVYGLAINPVMVYTGFSLGAGRVVAAAPPHVWAAIAIASGTAVLGIVTIACAMNKSHRHSFFRPISFKKLLDQLW